MTDTLLAAYRVMRTIRAFEERVRDEFAAGEIPGFVQLYAGEEASATGVCLHLDERDTVAGTHHGHGIAKGVDVKAMMAEIYGRKTGSCHGKGGSAHLADLAHGIVGGGPPLVCGTALAAKQQNTGGVGVAFFGDSAGSRGTTLEALNLAAVWDLPAIFVAENTGYADATSSSWSVAADNIADRAAGFGLPGVIVDGFDFFAIHEAAGEAVERARGGGGPTLIEVEFAGYFGRAGANPDCLRRFRDRVTDGGELAGQTLDDIDAEVAKLIEDAVTEAKAAPKPTPEDLETDVYATY
ncbi:thiamine pyrophosphate-dependent dehydrogenase E1 component subunit alpha [Amycolatopsis australiensis]|uniref:Pyruvate dehydrogenase E1 component alpha subunit n=1 Tax=Amycolatopsis australiensis TaxID=546364 RepID=A0A1K1PPK9_9PSEU|nr:thiamine pyrophosphate-dependent dehydrogenase E1 component subunit alpha [Amycolatopsis australiensis]SFW49411.1 pyruvate dehydrogenase E1 component alpha subunit [Amycolatopsis australiensis]